MLHVCPAVFPAASVQLPACACSVLERMILALCRDVWPMECTEECAGQGYSSAPAPSQMTARVTPSADCK